MVLSRRLPSRWQCRSVFGIARTRSAVISGCSWFLRGLVFELAWARQGRASRHPPDHRTTRALRWLSRKLEGRRSKGSAFATAGRSSEPPGMAKSEGWNGSAEIAEGGSEGAPLFIVEGFSHR